MEHDKNLQLFCIAHIMRQPWEVTLGIDFEEPMSHVEGYLLSISLLSLKDLKWPKNQ